MPLTLHLPRTFNLMKPQRISLGIFDKQGRLVRELLRAKQFAGGDHHIAWDGLDNEGREAPKGVYEWRMLETPGFESRFVGPLGINPSSGIHPCFGKSWVGDHTGVGLVCVDKTGVYLGSKFTEGLMQTLKQSHDAKTRHWQQPQYYDGGQLTQMAANGKFVFLIQKNGNLRTLDAKTVRLLRVWKLMIQKEAPTDIDAQGNLIVVCYPKNGAVQWLDESGPILQTISKISEPRAISLRANGEALVTTKDGIVSLSRTQPKAVLRISATEHAFEALDIDHATNDVLIIDKHNGERIQRYDRSYKHVATYGGNVRSFGRYDPNFFSGLSDVAADGQGGFYVTEPTTPPRRAAHFRLSDGKR